MLQPVKPPRKFLADECVRVWQVMKDSDIQNIKGLSQKDNVFELLSSSLAPSIYGHTEVKQAMLLLLLGGSRGTLRMAHIFVVTSTCS